MKDAPTTNSRKLRIGLLLCDDFGYAPMFVDGFHAADSSMELTPFECYAAQLPASPDGFDGYIISGSRKSTYDNLPWMSRLATFAQACNTARKRIAGVCFGHQFLAHALGGQSGKAAAGWGIGAQEINIVARQAWMGEDAKADKVRLIVMHQDQVTTPPRGTKIIAKNDFCAVSMFANDTVLGIQGHPEFSRAFCEARIHERRAILGDGVAERALHSLQNPQLDSAMVLGWVARFLRGDE